LNIDNKIIINSYVAKTRTIKDKTVKLTSFFTMLI